MVAQQAANDLDVLGAKGGATRGHGVRHARDVRGHDVRVALDDDDLMLGRDRLLRQVQAVQELRLLVDRRLGGVEILGRFLVAVVQATRAKTDRRARDIADRPHEAPTETVIHAAVSLRPQARNLDLLVREALGTQVAGEGIPRGRGIADPEMRAHRLGEAALGEKRAALVRLGGGQLLLVELFGDAVGVQESLALARLLGAHARPALLVVEGDPGLRRQHLHRLSKGQVVDLLHERDDVAALTTPEAVEHAQVGAHVEGGGALVVEGAQTLQGADTRGSQRYVFADDLVDLHCVTYRFDVVLTNQTRHDLSLPMPARVCVQSCSQL